jgi:hypothetical protein
MFVRDTQQQFRISNADVKMFYGSAASPTAPYTWNKPLGVGNIYMLLIGAGGSGDGTTGGGCGGVSSWVGAARHVPDSLIVSVGSAGSDTVIRYRTPSATLADLVTAFGAVGTAAGTQATATFFTAMGFATFVAGTAGSTSTVTASTTTFLTPGGATSNAGPWGYTNTLNGTFQIQPVLSGLGAVSSGKGGIGCGGGLTSGTGGPGMALIASW